MNKDIEQAVEVLRKGGTILYPTDTIWGIGCDATNQDAVKRVYDIKKRVDSKAMLVLLDIESRLTQYVAEVPEITWELLDAADKPLTIVYPNAKNLAKNLLAEDGSVGIRITHDVFCQKLINRFRKPIVSTSANISGQKSASIFDEIAEEIRKSVDYVVLWRQNDLTINPPSGIVKLDQKGRIEIIRK